MRKEDLRVILFALVVCIVCSLVLSVVSSLLREQQAVQVELDRQLNVLKAFGAPVLHEEGTRLGAKEVDKIFGDKISEIYIEKATGEVVKNPDPEQLRKDAKERTHQTRSLLPLYIWKENGTPTKYAFPIAGMGLWSIVNGYMALDRDLSTIIGVTFYKHGETPGLGGEVSADWFQNQFAGKKVYENGSLLDLEVVKGKAPAGSDHQVDGISGATMTGKGLNLFMNRDIAYYEKYFSRIRGS